MAAPTAKCSQFLRAISVEPSAPVKIGTFILTLFVDAELGLGVDHREERVVGVAHDAVGQALRAERVAHDVEVRVVDRVVLVAAGGDLAERPGIDDLAAAERGLEDLAVAPAVRRGSGSTGPSPAPRPATGSRSAWRRWRSDAEDSSRTPSLMRAPRMRASRPSTCMRSMSRVFETYAETCRKHCADNRRCDESEGLMPEQLRDGRGRGDPRPEASSSSTCGSPTSSAS